MCGFCLIRRKSNEVPKVRVTISVPADLRVKMIQFEVYPSMVARKAFEQEVRVREELAKLAKAKEKDRESN
jgi:hypothetical protein